MSNEKKKIAYDVIETRHGRFQTTYNEMYRRRKRWTPVNPKHLLSAIPGTVIAISVKEGDTVHQGQELMMYNAMKMDNRVLSPLDGVVKKICVTPGDKLPKGELMIEFL